MADPDYTLQTPRLLAIISRLSAGDSVNSLLQSVVDTATELTESESSSILVYEKLAHALHFIAGPSHQLDPLKTLAVPVENSVAGQVFQSGKPLILSQARNDERIFRVVDRELYGNTNSLIAVPIFFDGTPIGVIESINKANGLDYSAEDIRILDALASVAAVVIVHHRLRQEVQEAEQRVAELDKYKDSFAALVSHELRTPLGVVLGNAALLEENCTSSQRPLVELMLGGVAKLREVLEQITHLEDVKRLPLSRVQLTDILPLLKEVTHLFQDMANEKNISLKIDPRSVDGQVSGDRDQIAIVLRNLVKNALTFTNPGGWVRLRSQLVPGGVQITVSDNGIGISREDQERIFSRFYQAEDHLVRRHGGLGLGLSLARELVALQGGKLWVESELGRGSRFFVLLPTAKDSEKVVGGVFIL